MKKVKDISDLGSPDVIGIKFFGDCMGNAYALLWRRGSPQLVNQKGGF